MAWNPSWKPSWVHLRTKGDLTAAQQQEQEAQADLFSSSLEQASAAKASAAKELLTLSLKVQHLLHDEITYPGRAEAQSLSAQKEAGHAGEGQP